MKMPKLNCNLMAVMMVGSLASISSFSSSVDANTGSDPKKVLVKNNSSAENTAKALQEITQAEIDASFLIRQAMDNVNNSVLREKLRQYEQQCEEHIKTLSILVQANGREAPSHSRDFKGFFMQGYAAMRGLVSDQGVMAALHTNLQRILKVYESHLNSIHFPEDVKSKVRKIYDEDKKILEYVATQQ